MVLSVVFVPIALVWVVDVQPGVVFVAVAFMDVMDMARLVAVVLVAITFMDVMNVFASVVLVLVALVMIVTCSDHIDVLTHCISFNSYY